MPIRPNNKQRDAEFAALMVDKLREALSSNVAAGSVSVDGQTITFRSRKELLNELGHWQRELGQYDGTRPASATIRLG